LEQLYKHSKKNSAFEADFNFLFKNLDMIATQVFLLFLTSLLYFFVFFLLGEFLRARFRCRKIEKEILTNKINTLSTVFNRNKITSPCRVKSRRFLSSPRKIQTKL